VAFAASFAATFVLIGAHFFEAILPYYLVVMWTLLSIYLAYVIKRLLGIGAIFQAMVLSLALASSQVIASIYDFWSFGLLSG